MRYNHFKDMQLSALGLGMMRLPCLDEKKEIIDEDAAGKMVDFAIENGINYFDTAWMYHYSNSEKFCGRYLTRFPREKYFIADKFPGQLAEAVNNVQKTFETQLERCKCQYFDFYLLHNVYEKNIDFYLDDEKYRIVSYLLKQKEKGVIRHFGFSCHGSLETIGRFLEKYAGIMEFGQIQLNYLDWHLQDAESKVKLLDSYGIPVWVMEPLRGGKLANLSAEQLAALEVMRPGISAVEWGFRFLQTLPQVKMVLSGMSDMAQLRENIRIFSEDKPLSDKEFAALTGMADKMIGTMGVPCTGCAYCMDKCPKKLNIPQLLALYNDFKVSKGGWIPKMMIGEMDESARPSACIGCRNCEKMCPQQIRIADAMRDFAGNI